MAAWEQRDIAASQENHGSRAREAPALRVGRLYEQHERMVGALCRLLLRDPIEAEDALQQTFLSAFGSLIAGTEPRQPAAWLATIARRECWARTAQRRRRPLPLEEVGEPSGPGDPVEAAIHQADVAALWNAINDLPRTQREAFLLREFSGLSYAEVAVALGVTESAIESLLVRARRHLRDGLATTVATTNALLFPLYVLQQRLLRVFGGNNTAARTGAATAVGVPAAVKITATTAVIVAVGSVGAGVRTTWFSGNRPAPPARATAQKSAPAVLPRRAVGERRTVSSRTVRALGAGPLIFRTNAPSSTAAGSSRSSHARATADTTDRTSPPDDPPREPSNTPTGDGPAEATPTDTAAPEVATVPADVPTSDGGQTDGATSSTPQSDAAQSDTTQSDTTQMDTTQTDTTPTDTTATDTTPTDSTPADSTPTETTQGGS